MEDAKQIDKFIKKQEKSNPLLIPRGETNSLRDRFESFGFVKNEELLLSKFKFRTEKKCQLEDQSGNPIDIHFAQNTKDGNWKLVISSGLDSTEVKLGSFQELKYSVLDIAPGDYKEIVLLDEHYISNNELYTFSVYEIKPHNQSIR